MTVCICIFSFNRGPYLKNCIRSVEHCMPEPKIAVFDDNSDDPDTLKALREIEKKHTVIQPGHNSGHHLGGLYANMQSALDYCRKEELICFLQDDTQMVRPVTAEDIDNIHSLFDRNPQLGFLHPCFIKGINLSQGTTYCYDKSFNLYFREPTQRSAGRYFSALLITRPASLLKAGWRFASSEPANNRFAEKLFIPMGYLFAPFAMWLPEVPAYRGKKKTFALRLAEKKRRCGFYPFQILTPEAVDKLKSRDPSILPLAETFLSCDGRELPKPWAYSPFAGSPFIKRLNKLEVRLRRLFIR